MKFSCGCFGPSSLENKQESILAEIHGTFRTKSTQDEFRLDKRGGWLPWLQVFIEWGAMRQVQGQGEGVPL